MDINFGKLSFGSPVVGLALGAGGPRGWAHLGAIKAFEQANIKFDIVTGTSIGAVMGAFYAAQAMDRINEFASGHVSQRKTLGLLDIRFRRGGVVKGKKLIKFIEKLLPVNTFEQMHIPLGVVATELKTMQEAYFKSGLLMPAIRSSISIPGFLMPYSIGEDLYADGGMMNPVPVSLARRLGAEIVVAIDLQPTVENIELGTFGGIVNRSAGAMIQRIRAINYRLCPPDILIKPDLPGYGFMDYHRTREAIDEGYRAAHAVIPALKKMMNSKIRYKTRKGDRFLENLSVEKSVQIAPIKKPDLALP